MNIESLHDYCLSLPLVTEDTPFGEDHVVFRVCDKIFGCISLDRPDYFTVKCDPEYAIDLRDRYSEIEPAWHWNKKHWNQINLRGSLPDAMIKSLVRHSYLQVVKKLPARIRREHPDLLEVKE